MTAGASPVGSVRGETPPQDLLVRLYDLPARPAAEDLADGVVIRRVLGFDKQPLVAWVTEAFGAGWAGECDVACCAVPTTCFAASRRGQWLGFGCFDATFRGFFGPLGVAEAERGRGLGRSVLLNCLWAMRDAGYAYAVVGATRSAEFYGRVVGAEPIDGSFPGAYPPPEGGQAPG